MKLTWKVPVQTQKDYQRGKLNRYFFVIRDRRIGFGDYYLPLFCEYSRGKIAAGQTYIRFDAFAVQTVQMYADYLHQIKLPNMETIEIVQLLDFADYIGSRKLALVSGKKISKPICQVVAYHNGIY